MNNSRRLIGAVLVTGLLIAACGPGAATTAPTSRPATAPAGTIAAPTSVATAPTSTGPAASPTAGSGTPGTVPTGIEGNVDIHGSSTVAPISNAVALDLQPVNPGFSFVVGSEGTGAGFEDFFCVDNADISDASREMRAADPSNDADPDGQEEEELCTANGVEWVALKVAYDGLAVITHPDNAVECLTFADLYALLGPESNDIANWNDAETIAGELDSTTDLPDAALAITAPGDESGTYDSFIELVFGDILEERFETEEEIAANEKLRDPGPIYVASDNDNAIIQGVSGFPTSLGFVGLAFAEENPDLVKVVAVDGGEGCVSPTIETVSDGTYPISRPLFIYPNLGRAADNPAIVSFVDYYLSDSGIGNASEAGYVPLPADELQTTRDAWEQAKP